MAKGLSPPAHIGPWIWLPLIVDAARK